MHFIEWMKAYPHWNVVFWLALIGVGTVLELQGVFSGRLSTFTDFIRKTVPVWLRAAVLGMLAYHFLIDPVNFR